MEQTINFENGSQIKIPDCEENHRSQRATTRLVEFLRQTPPDFINWTAASEYQMILEYEQQHSVEEKYQKWKEEWAEIKRRISESTLELDPIDECVCESLL